MSRYFNIKSLSVAASALVLSSGVNAVVLNTLNGVDYQWMEMSETIGLSRVEVEARLTDSNDVLFGYEYASRQLVSELLLSYSSWDGLNGWHGQPAVVAAMDSLVTDFGSTRYYPGNGVNQTISTVDGFTVQYDSYVRIAGLYGLNTQCNTAARTCYYDNDVYRTAAGELSLTYQDPRRGWDPDILNPTNVDKGTRYTDVGSFLVKPSVVPIPAALWLFGSGLLGLIGVARRKVRT